MNFLRWTMGLPMAAAITLVLFAVMAGLIRQPLRTDAAKETPQLSIVPKIVETPIEQMRPVRPVPKEAPPAPETRNKQRLDPTGIPAPDLTRDGIDFTPEPTTRATPIVRIAPAYPEACRSRGAEGVVLVQFDVNANGGVTNIRVIASDNACFNRTVIRTVSGWKYPPEARRGVTERFVFKLSE